MSALFSGELPSDCCCVEITYGEETKMRDESGNLVSFAGARKLMKEVSPLDLVLVVDVTNLPSHYDLDVSLQKCKHKGLGQFLKQALGELRVGVFEDTPDVHCDQDQSDAFREVTDKTVFYGVMVRGDDYNEGQTFLPRDKFESALSGIIRIAQHFKRHWALFLYQTSQLGDQDRAAFECWKIIESFGPHPMAEQLIKLTCKSRTVRVELEGSGEKTLEEVLQTVQTTRLFQEWPNKLVFLVLGNAEIEAGLDAVPEQWNGELLGVISKGDSALLQLYQPRAAGLCVYLPGRLK